MNKVLFVLAMSALIPAALGASTVAKINGDTADRHIGLNSSLQPTLLSTTDASLLVGDDSYAWDKGDCASILVFQLPELGGEEISTANLTVTWDGDYLAGAGSGHPGSPDTSIPKWCDLYALRHSTSSAVLTNDFGYKSAVGVGDTLIQQQFLYAAANVTMDPTPVETDTAADVMLAAWLSAQYAAGAEAGDYVFLRVHGQFDTGNPFKISSANDSNSNQWPTLNITTGEIPPICAFNAEPTSGWYPLTVTFTDLSAGNVTNRFWEFGDGAATNTALPTVQHTYISNGTFTVSLNVSGVAGSDSCTQTDLITTTIPIAPTAGFSAAPVSGRAPFVVTFSDTSTGDITNRFWKFGDGTTTNTMQTSVQHTYGTEGTFTVALVCSGVAGSDTNLQTNLVTTDTPLPPGVLEVFSASADRTIGIDSNGAFYLDGICQPTIQCADDHFRYGKGECAAILVFELPDIGTQTVASANLAVEFEADYIQASAVDSVLPKHAALYGLRHAAENSVRTNDYGFRTLVPAGDTPIQEQFLVQPISENHAPTVAETDAAGATALAAWLQAQYDAGATEGDYVFLRVQATFDSFSPFRMASGDSPHPPTLRISLNIDGGLPGTPPQPTVTLGRDNGMFGFGQDVIGFGQDVIGWSTVQGSGYLYSVWFSTNLMEGFLPLETNLPDTVLSMTNFINEPSIFYRVEAH